MAAGRFRTQMNHNLMNRAAPVSVRDYKHPPSPTPWGRTLRHCSFLSWCSLSRLSLSRFLLMLEAKLVMEVSVPADTCFTREELPAVSPTRNPQGPVSQSLVRSLTRWQ